METQKINYRDQMFDAISNIIEVTGRDDANYDNHQKARDILEMLESLLAYAIYNTCISPETIRDSCEESYVSIKKRALMMFDKFYEQDSK